MNEIRERACQKALNKAMQQLSIYDYSPIAQEIIKEGYRRAWPQAALESAAAMIQSHKFSLEEIAELTDLSLEEVDQLNESGKLF